MVLSALRWGTDRWLGLRIDTLLMWPSLSPTSWDYQTSYIRTAFPVFRMRLQQLQAMSHSANRESKTGFRASPR
jgi:hypothetical protein